MTVQLPIRNEAQRAKLTARDFWLLADSGAFDGFAKTELIEGEIWVVNSVWVWHAKTVAYLTAELTFAVRALGSDLVVYGSGSVDLSDDNVPEPDVSVGEDHDGRALPVEKLRLAIEVSDSTLETDLTRKAPLYAAAGIPEYWVVDREGARIVQMWKPFEGRYTQLREVAPRATIESATIRGLKIEAPDL